MDDLTFDCTIKLSNLNEIDMGINIWVGTLSDESALHTDGYEREENKRYLHQFALINQILRSAGLPEHHEPRFRDPSLIYSRSFKTALLPFCEFVEMAEKNLGLEFPHARLSGFALANNLVLYLPLFFEQVFFPETGFSCEVVALGSSYVLYRECRLLARILDIYGDIESGLSPAERDPIIVHLEEKLGMEKEEVTRAWSILRHDDQEDSWPPQADGCLKLYEAAKVSVKHGAAIFMA
jgi:hypothetical protein